MINSSLDELKVIRQKFSKNEIDKYRKAFYDIENCRYLSVSEIEEAKKILIN